MHIDFYYEKFKDCKFELVHFDNGATQYSMQCYLLVSGLSKELLRDKGTTALDLGNYVYNRFGFIYEMPPEYYKKGEPNNSLAFYQSKEKFQNNNNKHIREWILRHDLDKKRAESILYAFNRMPIQHTAPYTDFIACWEKNGTDVIIRKSTFTEVIFEADGKDFKYLQAELGPESDFVIIGEL